MSIVTTNMGLTDWNSPSDTFDNTELGVNWDLIDEHDHSPGKGVLIPAAGLATGAVTNAKLGANSVSSAKLGASSVVTAAIADGAVTVPKLGTIPAARVYNSTNISIPDSTVTTLTFDTERFDTDTIHSTSSLTARLVCQTAGVYFIWGNVSYATNTTGYRQTRIEVNSGTTIIGRVESAPVTGAPTEHIVTAIYSLAATDYVLLRAFQNSGGPLNATAAPNFSPEFAMVRIG